MKRREAEKTLLEKRPHSEGCQRHATGMWDRSGNCERCAAWVTLNESLIATA